MRPGIASAKPNEEDAADWRTQISAQKYRKAAAEPREASASTTEQVLKVRGPTTGPAGALRSVRKSIGRQPRNRVRRT